MGWQELPCTIDHYGPFLALALEKLESGDKRLDLTGLERFDSSCLALILACRRRYPDLVVKNPPHRLLRLAKLYGIQRLMESPGSNES